LPRERHDALVCHEMAIILDGFVLLRVPYAERAAELPIGRFAPDVNQTIRPVDHRARTQMAVADAAEGNRITIRARAEFPKWFGGVVKIHYRAAVVAEIKFSFPLDH